MCGEVEEFEGGTRCTEGKTKSLMAMWAERPISVLRLSVVITSFRAIYFWGGVIEPAVCRLVVESESIGEEQVERMIKCGIYIGLV